MAVGQAVQQIGQIDPSSLIGRAATDIVEPRATAALIDAFRQGAISADDIVNRIGQLGQSKKKAEIDIAGAQSVQAQEAMSPAAVEARQQGLAANTAQGALAQAQAQAGMQNVDPAAELQAQQIEQQKVLIQYPAVAYFQKLAPAAGLAEPKLPDGTPDYVQMEKIGAELALHQSRRAEAQTQLDNITTQESADGSTLFARTKQGEFVDPKKLQQLRAQATRPFERQQPGTTVQAAPPVVEARATGPLENLDTVRARLAGAFGSDIVSLDDANLRRLDEAEKAKNVQNVTVAPRFSPGEVATVGAPAAGGISLGPPKSLAAKSTTAEQDKAALALSRFAESRNIQDSLTAAGYDPTSYGSWVSSMLPQVLKSGDRKLFETAVEAWGQGLLRLESGAAISPKEKTWYMQTFFPTVNDPPAVVQAKEGLRGSVEREMAEIALKGGVISPESVRNAARVAQQSPVANSSSGGAATAATPVITLPSGKRVRRNASGVFEEAN